MENENKCLQDTTHITQAWFCDVMPRTFFSCCLTCSHSNLTAVWASGTLLFSELSEAISFVLYILWMFWFFKPCFRFHHSFPGVKCTTDINQNLSKMLSFCFPKSSLLKIDSHLLQMFCTHCTYEHKDFLSGVCRWTSFFLTALPQVQKTPNSPLVTF